MKNRDGFQNRENTHIQRQGKYVYRYIADLILTSVVSGMFFVAWYRFVSRNNHTGMLLGLGNLIMSITIYTGLVVWSIYTLGGYRIGVSRMMNLIAAQSLGLMFTNIIDIFVSMAVMGQFRYGLVFLREYFMLWVVQSVTCGFLTAGMVNLYRRLFPPLQIIEIYGDYLNHLYRKVNTLPYKYHVCKLLKCTEAEAVIRSEIQKYDAVLVNDMPSHIKNRILKICFDLNKRVYFIPKLSDIIVKSSDDINLFDTPLCLCRNIGMTYWDKAIKRFVDVLLSSIALIITSPLLLMTAAAIKIEDHGSVFFRQERVTENGRRFMILKFRSMIVDAEKDNRTHPATDQDPRITKVGKVIRPTRIDELPQIINILKGDMSIVGPRPERWEHVDAYTAEIPEFHFRQKVKGGLTGYAQVYGKYNTSALDKLKLDLMYIENYSLLLDFQIIGETVRVLFQKEATEGFMEEDAKWLHDVDGFGEVEKKDIEECGDQNEEERALHVEQE